MTSQKILAERCAPFLPPGAEVRQAFIGQAAPNRAYFLITYLTGLTMFWIKYRCVAVTARRSTCSRAARPRVAPSRPR